MLSILLAFLMSFAFAAFKPLDAELKKYPYPFPVDFYEVKVKDHKYQMAFMDVRPTGEIKGNIVLLHGKNFSGNYWEKTIKDLNKEGYRVLVPDQIGFGKSSKPESFPYTFHLLATLTRNLALQQKMTSYTVIGHSMGGMLATRLALMFPEEVQKLILVNPIGLEDWKTMVPYQTVTDAYQAELKNNEEKIRNYQKASYFDGKWKTEYEKGIEILVGWTKHKSYPRIAWNAALTSDMVFTQPVLYEFKNLKMPTLLLLGTRDRTAIGKDRATPELKEKMGRYDLLGKEVIKSIPKGTLVELPGIGHMPQVENYDLYWQKLQGFLKK
ncbi:MAG: alpha/beta hydrolase [Bacteriovoracaceae bacterium]|nr:alpha/beta hydrolase [Bacteriovoracaceae bacterium]